MGTRWNCALFVALCTYRSKIEQQWNKAQMCITGSGFSCPQLGWRPGHIVLKGGRSDALSTPYPPPPTYIQKACYRPQHTLLPGCQHSTTITTTRTSPLIGLLAPVRLKSRHAVPTGPAGFKDGKLEHVTDPQRTDFLADKTISVCSLRSVALWPFWLYLWQASSLFRSIINPLSCLRLLLSLTWH